MNRKTMRAILWLYQKPHEKKGIGGLGLFITSKESEVWYSGFKIILFPSRRADSTFAVISIKQLMFPQF